MLREWGAGGDADRPVAENPEALAAVIESANSFDDLDGKIAEVRKSDPEFCKNGMAGWIEVIGAMVETANPGVLEGFSIPLSSPEGPFRKVTRKYGLRKKVMVLALEGLKRKLENAKTRASEDKHPDNERIIEILERALKNLEG